MQLSADFLEVFAVLDQSKIVGYVVYNPLAKRIHQLAVSKEFRNQGVATSLIHSLYEKHSFAYTIINIDTNDTILNNWLKNKGFETLVMLDELRWNLK